MSLRHLMQGISARDSALGCAERGCQHILEVNLCGSFLSGMAGTPVRKQPGLHELLLKHGRKYAVVRPDGTECPSPQRAGVHHKSR
jgi:hypothetical protein